MSVPKSKRSEGKLTVLVKANKLASYTMDKYYKSLWEDNSNEVSQSRTATAPRA